MIGSEYIDSIYCLYSFILSYIFFIYKKYQICCPEAGSNAKHYVDFFNYYHNVLVYYKGFNVCCRFFNSYLNSKFYLQKPLCYQGH